MSRRHAIDMVYSRINLTAVNDLGVVTPTVDCVVPFKGVQRNVTSEETDGATILATDKHVAVIDETHARQIDALTPDNEDTIQIDGVDHSIVMLNPKHWRGVLRSIDFIVRKV